MTHGVFITGTDTGVGKTRVGAEIARLLTTRGVRVRSRKPVESGCHAGPHGLVPPDATILRKAAGSIEPLEAICRYRLRAPVSPERAAQLEGMALDLAQLHAACVDGVGNGDFLLVEGGGGFHAPIAGNALNADLAGGLGLPVLVVAADRLGTLNHTFLTVDAVRMRGLALAGIVLNQPSAQSYAEMANADALERWLEMPVYRVPFELSGETGAQPRGDAGLAQLVDAWLADPARVGLRT